MTLSWRYCVCSHLIGAHVIYGPLPMRCIGAGSEDCGCSKFRDRSTWQRIRWAIWRAFRI